MSTRNYDSQLITKRLQDKVNAQFVSQVSAAKQSIQRPLLSTPTQSFVNEVMSGSMTMYAKSQGVMLRDVGACCNVAPAPTGIVDLGIGGSA
jgi:hypothetical protein